MSQRRLILATLAAFAAFPLLCSAEALPRNGQLGKRWRASDWTPKYKLQGFWVRRGASNEFDAEYTDVKSKSKLYWRIAILSVNGEDVRMRATMNLQGATKSFDFSGRLLSDGRTIRGRGGWCALGSAYCGFEVVADWPVAERAYKQVAQPGSASLPPPQPGSAPTVLKSVPSRLRVIDRAIPEYPYQGTWTITGNEVRFSYLDPSGKNKAEGFMSLEKWDGAYLVIRNSGARRIYQGVVQPGGKSIAGAVTPCPKEGTCTWVATIEK